MQLVKYTVNYLWQVLDVFFGIAMYFANAKSSPNDLARMRVDQIDNERTFFIMPLFGIRYVAIIGKRAAPGIPRAIPAPAPTPAEIRSGIGRIIGSI